MRITRIYVRVAVVILAWALAAMPALGRQAEVASSVPQTWQMLDYLATDYAGAVRDGAVVSASEYAEMREFAGTARQRLLALPAVPDSPALLAQADRLVAEVDARLAPAQVAATAHGLADALLAAYPVPTAPTRPPDLARGAQLYGASCASCHGAQGHGDGPAAAALDPAPVAFTDVQRADQRSALSLYEVISQGVPGTAMAAYAGSLSEADRWALAYYVGSLAYRGQAEAGAAAWAQDAGLHARITGLDELSRLRTARLATSMDAGRARAIVGYLRAHPAAVAQAPGGLALASARLAASVAAYREGDRARATTLALSSYLDGVEPVEPQLDARDGGLRARIETAMGAYRTAVAAGAADAEVARRAAAVDALLAEGGRVLADDAGSDPLATFLGALTILVREGLEALLVVVALLAFLRKAGRPEGVRYVHAGWIAALAAGGVTWALARYAVSISGAGRELTEGLSSLFAALVLLSVGLWMHQKSIGGRWQAYLRQKMAAALDQRSIGFLFLLAFITVYREVFETILFYAALWRDGQGGWLLGGIATGAAVLATIAWVMLRTSRRLPIGTFFSASSALIAVLAVVLVGKGVGALQEAGWIAVTPLAGMPHVELLGIYPTRESLLAQLAVALALAAGFAVNVWRGRIDTPRAAG